MRLTLLAFASLLAAPLAAQSGTTVWSIRMPIPDSLQGQTMGLTDVDLRLTLGTDGRRVGMQFDFGEAMAAALPTMDVSAMRIQATTSAGGDSVSIGVVLPPELAAMMGGGIGMRLDLAIPDSLDLRGWDLDSLVEANQREQPKPINTGRTDTVAGIACEEWRIPTEPTAETPNPVPAHLCLATSVPALSAFNTAVERQLPGFAGRFAQWKTAAREWFGGRDLVVVRSVIGEDEPIVVQLESVSAAAPDPSFFTLPMGLNPLPLDFVKGIAASARAQQKP